MRSDLRTAVIGCGYFGAKHAEKFAERSELRTVCDSNMTAACEVMRKTDAWGASEYLGLDSLPSDCDAVSICTPASTHYEIAKHFLKNGVHCLVEKPLATEVEQAEELAKIAQKKGLVLATGFLERFSTPVRWLAKAIERPFQLRCRRIRPYTGRGRDVSVVLDLMLHDIDLALALSESPLAAIESTGTFDAVKTMICFEDGSTAYLDADRNGRTAERSVSIKMPSASIDLEFPQEDILGREIESFLTTIEQGQYIPDVVEEAIYALQVAREIKWLDQPVSPSERAL